MSERRLGVAHLAVFLAGVAIALLMASRSQTGVDQYYPLVRGWVWYADGWLPPVGPHVSGGGFQPGALTGIVNGLPLFVWEDARAPNLFVLLFHVLAYGLILRATRDVLDVRERLLLGLFYWLNPWHLYFAAHVWNPNWLFPIAAVHLSTARAMKGAPRFWPTLLHVVAVGSAFQMHSSFLILAVATLLLWSRGYVRIHLVGAAVGTLLVLASLLPWMLVVGGNPGLLPIQENYPGWGLVSIHPVFRGAVYWLRYPTPFLSNQMAAFDFTPVLGQAADRILTPAFGLVVKGLGPLMVGVTFAANLWFLRRTGWSGFDRFARDGSRREWLHGYARWVMVAAFVAFCLSPSTIMMWMALIAFHAAVLPVVFWLGALWRTRARRRMHVAVPAYAILLALLGLALAFGSPRYRAAGRDGLVLKLEDRQPWLDRLNVPAHSTLVVDPVGGLRSCLLEGRDEWLTCVAGKEKI